MQLMVSVHILWFLNYAEQASLKMRKPSNSKCHIYEALAQRERSTLCWSLTTVETNSLSPTICLSRFTKSLLLIFLLYFNIKRHTTVSMPVGILNVTENLQRKINNLEFFIIYVDQVHVRTRQFSGNGGKKHWKGHPRWTRTRRPWTWSTPKHRCLLLISWRCQGLETIILITTKKKMTSWKFPRKLSH